MSSAIDFGLDAGDTVIAGAPAAWRLTACRDAADGGVHLTRWYWDSCGAEWCLVSDLPDPRGGDFHLSADEQRALVAFLAPSEPPRASIAPFTRAERKALSTVIHMARKDGHITGARCTEFEALVDGRSVDRGGCVPPAPARQPAPDESDRARDILLAALDHGCQSSHCTLIEAATRAARMVREAFGHDDAPTDPIEQLRLDATAVHDRVSHAMRRHGAR